MYLKMKESGCGTVVGRAVASNTTRQTGFETCH